MTRKTLELFEMDDSRGVSPVIGVILMVAITVILAAVIGTFVLGLGENVSSSTPQSQLTLSADEGTDNISVDHKGGDAIPAAEIQITVTGPDGAEATFDPYQNSTEELTVGDTGVLDLGNGDLYWSSQVAGTHNSTIALTSGDAYTVQIVHTESDQLIMDRTVRP